MEPVKVRRFVRERYGKIAREQGSCCGPSRSCCGSDAAGDIGRKIGYSDSDLSAVPNGANLGLGCGNPIALASLKAGETVVDLGSGAGFDCFLAARQVGPSGRVIGVDMTPEMVEKARMNAAGSGMGNVEFRLGEIERLPVSDASADAIISNCVINLSPDKEAVFAEAFRVLKPGGRVMISDIMLTEELPDEVRGSLAAHAGCIAGAIPREEYLGMLRNAGFEKVTVVGQSDYGAVKDEWDGYVRSVSEQFGVPETAVRGALGSIASVGVSAVKPAP